MGFWHTGYIEFHEPVGLDEYLRPAVARYCCKHCEDSFDSLEALRSHRFENHPYNRPVLLVRGVEVGSTPIRITRPLDAAGVATSHCEQGWINSAPIPPGVLGEGLSSFKNETVKLRLVNEGVVAEFTLRFEVADTRDLEGVERCFFNAARRGRLDMRAVEDFITAARAYPTAAGYYDGICNYFYGVLIKEGSEAASLEYAAYREKFNQAADTLRDFDRRLARTICALIAFHFNNFAECVEWAEVSRVGTAARRFTLWIDGHSDEADDPIVEGVGADLEKLLTDYETERLLAWSMAGPQELEKQLTDIEAMTRQDIPEFDRTKLRVLLAEFYARKGNAGDARRHARELRSSPALGAWAEGLITRVSAEERANV